MNIPKWVDVAKQRVLANVGMGDSARENVAASHAGPDAPLYEFAGDCQIPHLSLYFSKYFGNHLGTFVEVGAFDGVTVSNSLGLLRQGWRGIYVEADPLNAARCSANLARFPNASVHVAFMSDTVGVRETLYRAGPLSTTSPAMKRIFTELEWAKRFVSDDQISVTSTTLTAFLEEHLGENRLDVLIVDVEGGEASALKGLALNQWRPSMIIVELTDHHPDLQSQSVSHQWVRRYLHDNGYCAVYADAINSIYVTDQMLEHPTS